MRSRLLLLATAAAALAGTAAAASPPFTPATLAGSWKGSWQNTTFGSSGPASLVATAKGGTLAFTADLGGQVFGCPDPPADVTRPMTKGSGPMHWNAAGFAIAGGSKGLGTVVFRYRHATHTLTGSGVSPRCSPGLKWALSGRFVGRTFTGTVHITLSDGQTATSTLTLKRWST